MRDFEDYCWRDILSPEMDRIFGAYRRPRTVASRPAILVMHPDPAATITAQANWHVEAQRLIEAARGMGLAIVHLLEPGAVPAGPIAPAEGDRRCVRAAPSAFLFTDLEVQLTRAGANGVVLCGGTMSGPLRATTVDAKSYGYPTAIAEDATCDEASLLHKVALFDAAHKYADVMTTGEIIQALAEKGAA